MTFNKPVLLLIFNRPGTTEKVFDRIKAIQPAQLYIAADGPRSDRVGEQQLCEQTRAAVLNSIDWKCEVKTLFRDVNLGCGRAVSEGISWFFSEVEDGIILEDDTLVDISFFYFAAELLDRYKNNTCVTSITAANLMANKMPQIQNSYTYSNYGGIWGWASWRRAWAGYDYSIAEWHSFKTRGYFLKQYGLTQALFFYSVFEQLSSAKAVNTWDYQWWFHQLKQGGLSVIPANNLVENIGFGEAATHTSNVINPELLVPVERISFPLQHPVSIAKDKDFEKLIASKFYSNSYTALQKIKLLKHLLFKTKKR